MRAILAVDPAARLLRCEAGATLQSVHDAARAIGLLYPVDYASKGTAQVGGSIATNAGGVRVLRYGVTRGWVSGVRVVIASGEVLDLGGALVKDNTGYDLRQLFIGSEGTLGVVVEATLKLCAPPRDVVVALAAVPSDTAILELFAVVQKHALLQAFECFDDGCLRHVLAHRGAGGPGPFAERSPYYVLLEAEVEGRGVDAPQATVAAVEAALVEAGDRGALVDAVVATTPKQARDLWSLREDVSESLHRAHPHKSDVAVPVSRVAAILAPWRAIVARELPGAEALAFGHVGDGNLHLNAIPPAGLASSELAARLHALDEAVYALVRDEGGSISAEHGIGLLKREWLHYRRTPTEIAMMRAIKSALDPGGLFNPGKIFAP
jgi:FAD/FMN-containing dehydrogenase